MQSLFAAVVSHMCRGGDSVIKRILQSDLCLRCWGRCWDDAVAALQCTNHLPTCTASHLNSSLFH